MIREIRPSDIPRLRELWEQKGFECRMPDFSRLGGMVLVDARGVIREAVLDRTTCELYFLIDHGEWETPGMKWTQFERLHEAERRSLAERGYEDGHSWYPKIARSFGRRLRKILGWVYSDGPDRSWTGITRDV